MDSENKIFNRRDFLKTSAFSTAFVMTGCTGFGDSPLVEIYHQPKLYSRRYGDFTANICGKLSRNVKYAKYQLNKKKWMDVKQGKPRIPPPLFTIELNAKELERGTNHLEIEVLPKNGKPENFIFQFDYDPAPVRLPMTQNWANADLDVQDGRWETFLENDIWRVRPKPGSEGYDRIVAVTGALPGARRIETDLVFRKNKGYPFGFGVLPLWGGRPDLSGYAPRRGWNFSLVWFYAYYEGVGMEFSYKFGNENPKWVSSYRDFKIEPGVKYFLEIECWPEKTKDGRHKCYHQRMRWQKENTQTSFDWMELRDVEGSPLPESEYAVALVSHRSSVDFGPVKVSSM